MTESGIELRETINGAHGARPTQRRRQRFEGRESQRSRTLVAVGFGAAAGIVVAVIGGVFLHSEPERGETRHVNSVTPIAHLPAPTPSTTHIADGAAVPRHVPLGLGGRVLVDETEPKRVTGRDPAPLRRPKIEAPDGAAARAPAAASAGAGTAAALVAAGSNLVWSRLFAEIEQSFPPLRHADAALWAEGGCAQRAAPEGPTYCALDRTLYFEPEARLAALDMLAVAHEIGHHVQDALGVALPPLSGKARDLQADCFAGLWAGRAPAAEEVLTPGALAIALGEGAPLAGWPRERHAAFAQGYAAADPMACAETGSSRMAGRPE